MRNHGRGGVSGDFLESADCLGLGIKYTRKNLQVGNANKAIAALSCLRHSDSRGVHIGFVRIRHLVRYKLAQGRPSLGIGNVCVYCHPGKFPEVCAPEVDSGDLEMYLLRK